MKTEKLDTSYIPNIQCKCKLIPANETDVINEFMKDKNIKCVELVPAERVQIAVYYWEHK